MLKRILCCAMALVLIGGGAMGEALTCVRAPGVAALVDERGVERVENGRYGDLFAVREGELYAAGSRGAYRLLDAEGTVLNDAPFAMIDDAGVALVFRRGALFGAMDGAGNETVPAEWTQLACDGLGGFLALDGDPTDDAPDGIVHISASGEATPTGVAVARGLSPVKAGRMPFVTADGLYGAVDAGGSIAIEPTWRYIGAFDGGLAKARGDGGMGLIDADGHDVIAPVYDWLERSGAMIAAGVGGRVDVYGVDGEWRYNIEAVDAEAALVGEYLAMYAPDGSALYDAAGAVIAERGAGTTFAPGVSGQIVATDGEWGEACQYLIDPDGSDASGPFQQLLPLCEGRYAFLQMAGVEYYSEELGRIKKSWDYAGARYGLADDRGNVVLPAEYREIIPAGADRLALVGDDGVTLVDPDGNIVRTWATVEAGSATGAAGA